MRESVPTSAESSLQTSAERPERLVRHKHRVPRARLIRAAAEELERLHQLAAVGESEWTPWVAIAGLSVFFAAIELLIFGTVEAAAHLLASAP